MSTDVLSDPWRGLHPLDPAARDDPHPALRTLREREPVSPTPIGTWRLTRYADCMRLLREVKAGVRTTAGRLPFVEDGEQMRGAGGFMLQQDPPNHTRLRKLVSKAFTPRAVESLRPGVERIVASRLDAFGPGDELDLVAELALPVPSTVICEMMGVPVEDRDRFTVWTSRATHALAIGVAPPDVIAAAREASEELGAYFAGLVAERRDRLGDDILSTLIRAEEEGDRLGYDELIIQSIGLLIAGFETTIGLIANGVRQLLLHPAEFAKLRARPELVASAVEECLRFDGPILLTVRVLHEDVEFHGVKLPRDTQVMAMLAAANRDPAVFEDPERFDVERDPNPHLAFGGGTHLCLGAHLARMEAQTAIAGLLSRFHSLELVDERVEWGPSLFRVPGSLRVRVG